MPPETEKKGFGAKLKGVGKAIGRGLKKVPGIAYRDVVKPYGEHLRDKFTEPIDISPLAGPIDRLPIGMGRKAAPKKRISDLAGPIKDLPIGMGRKAAPPKRKATPGRGRTGAYDPSFTGKSAVERLAETAPKKTISPTPKTTPKKEPRTQSEGRVTKSTDLTAGKQTGEVVTVIGEMPKKRTPRRAKKGPARKFSPKQTGKTLQEAGKARKEAMEKTTQIDTTAAEMARILTEQEVGREAERAEAALKGGRKPTREKARYRLRTRGYKRSEGRSR